MADRYRLPEALGGGECVIVEELECGGGCPSGLVIVETISPRLTVQLDRSALTKVESPLPPEPPLWAVVIDKHERAWQHVNDGRGEWCCTVSDLGADWDELQEFVPLTQLVPDPAAGVELPWGVQPRVWVDEHVDIDPMVGVRYKTDFWLRSATAREMAAALWAAADAAGAGAS